MVLSRTNGAHGNRQLLLNQFRPAHARPRTARRARGVHPDLYCGVVAGARKGSKRFLFVTWDGGGNFVPALRIAGVLAARGHEIVFSGQRSLARRVERRGFAFHAFERVPEWTAGLSIEEERPAFAGLLSGADTAEDVTVAIDRVEPDAIVVDCMLAGGLAAAERSRVPAAALVHVLDHACSEGILARSFSAMMPVVNDTRSGLGLAPVATYADLLAPMTLVLVTAVELLDLPASKLQDNVRYIGPAFDEEPQTTVPDLPADDRPLVVVSFSTTYQHQEKPLQRVADALAELQVHGIMTLGDVLEPDVLSLPPNVAVRVFAPHDILLPRASLVVTHAGLGTVMAALAHGVPLVCMPMGRDQDANARRIEARGAGLTLPVEAGVPEIAQTIAEVLQTPSYRDAARRLQGTVSCAPGAAGGADALEHLWAR
jgi:MGT family glycosyltransferase